MILIGVWCMVYGVWCIKITNQENEIDESFATYNLRVYLVVIFKNYFLYLKTKNIKNMFGEGGVVCVLCFSCSQKVTILKQ